MNTRRLTGPQRWVLALVANGRTNAQIGRRCGLTDSAVNKHLLRIYKALGARDRTHAVALALCTGDLTTRNIQPRGGEQR